jgi:UDP-N-acetylglucosamine--dolichyl-phosphate N-acetylglucosaminephosphotransferase
MFLTWTLAASLAAAGVVAYLLTRWFSEVFPRHGISGLDVHKAAKPVTAEMGGAAVAVSVMAGALVLVAGSDPLTLLFAAGLATVGLVALVGAVDDYWGVRQRYKPFLVAAAGAPLAFALAGRTSVAFPFIGTLNFGILYPVVVVPLALTTSANFSNMFAGFNGLEAGTSALAIGTITALAALRGSTETAYLGLVLLVPMLAFMKFNWYPSRIFPGDTGTLAWGAAIVTLGLMGRLEFAAVVVSMPAAIDFSLKMLSRNPFAQRSQFGDSTLDASGHLVPSGYPALAHAMMKASPVTERELVVSLLVTEACFCALAAALTLVFL